MRYRIRRDRDRPLEFTGELLGEVTTRFKRERWTELRLFQTVASTLGGAAVTKEGSHTPEAESFVTEQVGASTVVGEVNRCKAWVCADEDEVRRCLGDGPLARQLYLESGLEGTENVSAPSPSGDDQGERDGDHV